MTSTAIFIPARYHSTRFPGKPLCMLDGKTMIERVVNACKKTSHDVYVLTDDTRIAQEAERIGVEYFIEGHSYENGTERVAGAINSRKFDDYDQFINVQGDMPDVTPECIDKCIWQLKHYPITTVFTDMPEEMQNDPNSVKMIRSGDQALWFGRGMTGYGDWHLGVYGYKINPLQFYSHYEVTKEERVEKLEQLRWLKSGWQIGCLSVQFKGIEINAPEDIKAWQTKFQQTN